MTWINILFLALVFAAASAHAENGVSLYLGGGYQSVNDNSLLLEPGYHGKAMVGFKQGHRSGEVLGLVVYERGLDISYYIFKAGELSSKNNKVQVVNLLFFGKFGRFSRYDDKLKRKLWPVFLSSELGASFQKIGALKTEIKFYIDFGMGIEIPIGRSHALVFQSAFILSSIKDAHYYPMSLSIKL